MVYLIPLTFVLDEEVTPDLFAQRVAQACAQFYALRPGEGIQLPSDKGKTITVTEERVDMSDLFPSANG